MGKETGIEWTDATWNPIRGCNRVSEGCRNCYAESIAKRFSGPGQPYEGLIRFGSDGKAQGWSGDIRFVEDRLLDPLRWKRPRRIFVNSMSDLFHENVTDEMRDRIFAVMALCPQHIFQVLTKRPERMLRYMQGFEEDGVFYEGLRSALIEGMAQHLYRKHVDAADTDVSMWLAVHLPLPSVWLGVSVENQQTADERIPLLLQTPAAVRFLSCEPLLGEVDLHAPLHIRWQCSGCRKHFAGAYRKVCPNCQRESYWSGSHEFNGISGPFPSQTGSGIDWVIAGGESGRNARPMHPDWARSLRDQCAAAGVPFFFKQWGEWAPSLTPINTTPGRHPPELEDVRDYAIERFSKKAAGDLLDGVQHHAFPGVQ